MATRHNKVQQIAVRDGWTCWLCLAALDATTATLDHVVPIAHGGRHGLDNLRLAHQRCNELRGTQPGAPGMFSAAPPVCGHRRGFSLAWRPCTGSLPFDEALAQQKQDEETCTVIAVGLHFVQKGHE